MFLISTGGGNYENKASLNLVHAAFLAKKRGLKIISLVGKSGGELKKISDLVIVINCYFEKKESKKLTVLILISPLR